MNIGLNLLYLIPAHVGGTQTYAESLLDALARLDTSNKYTVFLNQEAAELPIPAAFQRVVCPCRATSRMQRYAWEQAVFPRWLKRFNIDLVHSLGYVCPFRPGCRSVVSIHDVNYVGLGRAMPRGRRAMLRFFVPQSARCADHVIAMTNFSKREIMRHMGIAADKITVTHEAPGTRQVSATPVDWDDVAAQHLLKSPYLIAFSSLSAHKNMSRLLRAYAQLLQRWPEMPHDLVLLGHLPPNGPLADEIASLGLEQRVVATGYVPDEQVLPIISHAEVLAFPSWYEGFGLPVLEAQSAGVALACSSAASLPEVAGEGALYYNPRNVDEMSRALELLLRDKTLRASLAQKGRDNVLRFSWDKTARETLDVYQRVLG